MHPIFRLAIAAAFLAAFSLIEHANGQTGGIAASIPFDYEASVDVLTAGVVTEVTGEVTGSILGTQLSNSVFEVGSAVITTAPDVFNFTTPITLNSISALPDYFDLDGNGNVTAGTAQFEGANSGTPVTLRFGIAASTQAPMFDLDESTAFGDDVYASGNSEPVSISAPEPPAWTMVVLALLSSLVGVSRISCRTSPTI